MRILEAYTLAEIYLALLNSTLAEYKLNQRKLFTDTPYKNTTVEFLGPTIVLHEPRANLIACSGRRFNYRYMIAEMLWNLCGTGDIDVLQKVFPGVTRFVSDQPENLRRHATWAYGTDMSAGFWFILHELEKDLGSRRAIAYTTRQFDYGTPPCLSSIQFIVRGSKLDAFVTMRSNDIWRGFPLDVYQFTMWQIMLANCLKLKVGKYYHHVGSLHMYDTDRLELEAMLEKQIDSIETSAVSPGMLKNILNFYGSPVITAMRDPSLITLNDIDLRFYLYAYHNMETMPKEFRQLKSNNYGTW